MSGTYGSVQSTRLHSSSRTLRSLYDSEERGSSLFGLERHAEDADGHVRQRIAALDVLHEEIGQTLVNHHGGLAEHEGAVIEGAQLHGVLEQARAGRETGTRQRLHARIVLAQGVIDAVEIGLEVLGHDVELIGDGEIDVAPGVAEQLGQLGLDRAAGTAPWGR